MLDWRAGFDKNLCRSSIKNLLKISVQNVSRHGFLFIQKYGRKISHNRFFFHKFGGDPSSLIRSFIRLTAALKRIGIVSVLSRLCSISFSQNKTVRRLSA